MKTIVCEPICTAAEHSAFNATILQMIMSLEGNNSVVFLCERSHAKLVRELLPADVVKIIRFEEIAMPRRAGGFVSRSFREFIIAVRAMTSAKRLGADVVFFTSMRGSFLNMLMCVLMRKSFKNFPLYAIIHMEMKKIKDKKRNPISRIFSLRASLLRARNKRIRFCVLEEPIAVRVRETEPSINVGYLPHPVVPRIAVCNRSREFIDIGFLGIASSRKGFNQFCEFARLTRKFDKLRFHVIGRKHDVRTELRFATGPFTSTISVSDYETYVSKVHYVCVFLDAERYDWSASGTLLDAISFEKPIIAFNIAIIDYLFENYGDIGYQISNVGDATQLAGELQSGMDFDRYEKQLRNIRNIATDRDPKNLAEKLKNELALIPA